MTTIVDLSVLSSARFCARMAAVAGDDVVRFSEARSGDAAGVRRVDVTDAYLSMGVTTTEVNWSSMTDRGLAEDAIRHADAVISSFSDGTFDSPYDEAWLRSLNPGAVHVVVSPFGTDGPYRDFRGSSLTDWASGGYLYITGEVGRPPLAGPYDLCAKTAGYVAAIGLEAALSRTAAGGSGITLDISHMESMLSLHQALFARLSIGEVMSRAGNVVGPATHPHGPYPCSDGELFVAIVTDEEWDRFLIAIDRPELCDDPRFATGAARQANRELTDELVASWTINQETLVAASYLQEQRVPVTECATPDSLLDDAQIAYRGYLRDVAIHRDASVSVPGNVLVIGGRGAEGPPDRQSDKTDGGDPPLPLAGVTVLDISLWWAGPMATRILGDLGANVIRVERPTQRDDGSVWPGWHRFVTEQMQRNKRSIVVDLRTPEGAALVQALATNADVLIQNFRPGVLERLGLGWKSVLKANPRLVYVSLSGYGQQGPKSGWGTYGTVSEVAASTRFLTRYPGEGSMRLGDQLPDAVCGLAAVVAALRGLRERRQTNIGSYYDISQLEAYVATIGEELGIASLNRAGLTVVGEEERLQCDVVLRCQGEDDWVAATLPATVAARNQLQAGLGGRMSSPVADLIAELRHFAADRSKQEVAQVLQDLGAASFPVATAQDLTNDPQLIEHDFFLRVVLDGVSGVIPGSPIRGRQGPMTRLRRMAPAPGQHSSEILEEMLGLSRAQIADLTSNGIIR